MTPAAREQIAIPTTREAVHYVMRLLWIVRPYWRRFIVGTALGTAAGVIGLVIPYLSKLLFDEVYPSRDVSLMHLIVLGVFVASLATSVVSGLRGYYTQVIGSQLSAATSLAFFNHVQHLPTQFFDEHRVGEVMSRFADVRSALAAVTGMLQTVLGSGLYLVLVPPLLFVLNWHLALLALITVPVTTTFATVSSRYVRRYWKASAEAAANYSALQVEVCNQIRTIKALAAEHHVYRTASEHTRAIVRTQAAAGGLSAAVGTLNGLVRAGGSAVFSWYAWSLILQGRLSLGEFVAFSAYLGYLTGPVSQFAGLFSGFQQTAVTLGRMFQYLDEIVEQDSAGAYVSGPRPRRAVGDVHYDRVTSGYSAHKAVLRDLTLTLPAGSVTALVGPSGAGKSTVLRVLCRMAQMQSGRVTIDACDITSMALADVRQQVSVVWQEFAILGGSLRENLTYGISDVDTDTLRARVEDAVRVCAIERFIRDLPDGLDTVVGEWGAQLSGGQRQRLAIARALVRNSPVLLLDEVTSQVDTETEEEIYRNLLSLPCRPTILFVTHRLRAAMLADQICVLESGRMVGIGAHLDLLTRCELYRRMIAASGIGTDRSRSYVAGAALHVRERAMQ